MSDTDGHILYKRLVNLLITTHSAETFRKEVWWKCYEDHTRIVYTTCAVQSYFQHMGWDKQWTSRWLSTRRCTNMPSGGKSFLFKICFCNVLIIWKAMSNVEKLCIFYWKATSQVCLTGEIGGQRPPSSRERLVLT